MTERKNQQWILKARPEGGPLAASKIFEKRTQTLGEIDEGQVLAQVLYLSFDPVSWAERTILFVS